VERVVAAIRRTVRPGLRAAAHGALIFLLSLTADLALLLLSLGALLLLLAGLGVLVFPVVTGGVRAVLDAQRRLAPWAGVTIPRPYRPVPPDAGRWRRFRILVGDPATWLDLAWLLVGSIIGAVVGGLSCFVPLYGLEGILLLPLILSRFLDWYGYGAFWPLRNTFTAALCFPQGLAIAFAGLSAAPWLMRRYAMLSRHFLAPTRAARLAQRVDQLTTTRAETVDAQAAELRRIERDLHDGAQARLVSLSMSIGLAEQLLQRDPAAAQQLLAEARESSGQALVELRDLVRGIHPPVLAERGLDGAIRALALRVPLHTEVDIVLAGRPDTPVESAAYFAVAEVLTNAAKHAAASTARVRVHHTGAALVMVVSDDGRGGADPAAGSGLRGIERRLAAFDGTMAVASPPGGPTIVTMELPCALSSPKTTPS
jgi:signal transduction histidine kinase